MVHTEYPVMFRYANKWTIIAYGLIFFGPLHHSFFVGHFAWKRGKLPRLTHNDMKYQGFVMDSGFRTKYLHEPAINWYPDVRNRLHMKTLKRFLKKNRQL
jgi:hypothetical protein